MQLASTSTPRSAINSVTCSYDSGYRRYKRTHKMINSPGCCRPLKGLVGVIGIDFYPTSMPAPEFATKPPRRYPSRKDTRRKESTHAQFGQPQEAFVVDSENMPTLLSALWMHPR